MQLETGYEAKRARVELLPMIDVVFLLLVFFIYAMMSMVVHRGMDVTLPEASTAKADTRAYIAITIQSNGDLLVNETPVDLETLDNRVQAAQADLPEDAPIYLVADREADVGIAVSVMDRLRKAGIERFVFEVEKAE